MYPTVTSSCSVTGRVKQKDVIWFRFLLFLCPARVVFTRHQSAVAAGDISLQFISIQKGRLRYSLIVFLCIPSFTKFPSWCTGQVFCNQISLNGGHSSKKYTHHAPVDQIMNLILSFTSSHNKQSLSSTGLASDLPASRATGDVPECNCGTDDVAQFTHRGNKARHSLVTAV